MCEYCELPNNESGPFIVKDIEAPDTGAYIYRDIEGISHLYVNVIEPVGEPIGFCPMCGHDLRNEA